MSRYRPGTAAPEALPLRARLVALGRRTVLARPWLDHCEPLLCPVELIEDARLDVVTQRRVGPGDEFPQHRDQRGVLAGQLLQPGPGGVDQAGAVVGEVGDLDDPGPRACLQACRDMVAG